MGHLNTLMPASISWGTGDMRLYAKRSGIERMNGRLDGDYKFERRTVRGLFCILFFANTWIKGTAKIIQVIEKVYTSLITCYDYDVMMLNRHHNETVNT